MKTHPYILKQNYLIETVTKYFLGKLVAVTAQELVLDEASWVVDTGRYNEALKAGSVSEVEPCPGRVLIGRGSIVAAVPWPHKLIREAK